MAVIGIRKLSEETSKVIKEFEKTGEPVIVTRHGNPIGALVPVDKERLDDLILSTAPEFHASVERADADFEEGRTRPLADYARKRGIDLSAEGGGADEGGGAEEASPPQAAAGDLVERMRAATEQELVPLTSLLNDTLAVQVVNDASADVGALSREALAALRDDPAVEDAPAREMGELAEGTAVVYTRLLARDLLQSLPGGDPTEALAASRLRATNRLRRWSKTVVGPSGRSVDDYLVALRAVRAAFDLSEEPEAAEESAEAAQSVPASWSFER